jgi:spore coat polysaccharide biosynthesis protein SpsF
MTAAVIDTLCEFRNLPDGLLSPILGRPMLELMIERLRFCRNFDDIIVSTTASADVYGLESYADIWGVGYRRGTGRNEVSRYLRTADEFGIDIIIALKGNCPFIDPGLVDRMLKLYADNADRYDYCSNLFPRTYPRGLEVEVVPLPTLKKINEIIPEFMNNYNIADIINEHPKDFRIGNIADGINRSMFKWAVNSMNDYQFVTEICQQLYRPGGFFGREDIFDLLRSKPELMAVNGADEKRFEPELI